MSQFILATGGYDSQVRLFDATNARSLGKIVFQENAVLGLAFSNGSSPVHAGTDPLFIAVAGSPRIAIYDMKIALESPASARPQDTLFSFDGHTAAITAIGFDPTSTFPRFAYSASEDGTLQVWDPHLAPAGTPPQGAVGAAAVDPGPARVVPPVPLVQAGRSLSTQTLAHFENYGPIHAAVYFAEKMIFITADHVGRLRLWDYATRKLICSVRPHAKYDVGDDDEKETDAVNKGRSTWERGPECKKKMKNEEAKERHLHDLRHFELSPGESPGVALPAKMKRERCIDRRGIQLQTLELFTSGNDKVSIVTADTRGGIFVYRVDDMLNNRYAAPYAQWCILDTPHVFGALRVYVTRTRVSMNGQVLCCTMSSGTIKLYDMSAIDAYVAHGSKSGSPKVRKNFLGHSSWVWDAVFVGDADNMYYIFTCGSDMHLMLWNLDIDEPNRYPGHEKSIVCLAIKEQYFPQSA